MSILTDARGDLWDAIDARASLVALLNKTYRFDDKQRPDIPEPSLGDVPAMTILTAGASSDWVTNQNQQIDYTLSIVYWTPIWDVAKAEQIWEETTKAIWQNLDAENGVINRIKGTAPLSGPVFVRKQNISEWRFGVDVLVKFWNPKIEV